MMLFTLLLLRLVVALEARTVATVVFALEQETTVERGRCKCAQDEQWKETAEDAAHDQIY